MFSFCFYFSDKHVDPDCVVGLSQRNKFRPSPFTCSWCRHPQSHRSWWCPARCSSLCWSSRTLPGGAPGGSDRSCGALEDKHKTGEFMPDEVSCFHVFPCRVENIPVEHSLILSASVWRVEAGQIWIKLDYNGLFL